MQKKRIKLVCHRSSSLPVCQLSLFGSFVKYTAKMCARELAGLKKKGWNKKMFRNEKQKKGIITGWLQADIEVAC